MIKWYEESDAEVNRSIALITFYDNRTVSGGACL
jgi:hypothetical protein